MPKEKTTLPFPFPLVDRVGEALLKWNLHLLSLSIEDLHCAARRATGLEDFGDDYYLDGLQRLLHSLEEDVSLRFLGRYAAHEEIVRCLANRLLLIDFLKRNPQIRNRKVDPPLVITGLPRTGTTFLHRMLAQDPQFRYLPFWEAKYPIPFPARDKKDPSWRVKAVSKGARLRRRLMPGLDRKHYLRATSPEEDLWLLGLTFHSPEFWVLLPVYGYFRWLLHAGLTNAFKDYLDILRILQAGRQAARLLLKAPMHLGNIAAYRAAVPGVMFIQTHRDPVAVFSSVNSLIHSVHEKLVKSTDRRRLAGMHIEYMQGELKKAFAARPQYPGLVLDVLYDDLVRAPKETVRFIYRHFGLPWSGAFERRLNAFILEHPKDKYGKHRYRASGFGLEDDFTAGQFECYASYVEALRRTAPEDGSLTTLSRE